MGFFSSIFRCRGGHWGRFVSEMACEKNMSSQVAMTETTLRELRKCGVGPDALRKLEFFFYTNTDAKAACLAASLRQLGYSVEHGPSAHDARIRLITGWTDKMSMSEQTVVDWARQMCELARDADCEFDGWGTDARQE